MPMVLERWNDDKMDGLAAKVDRIDLELREQRQDLRELRKELHEDRRERHEDHKELHENLKDMNKRFDAFSRTMIQATLGMATGFVIGWGALVGLIATQL